MGVSARRSAGLSFTGRNTPGKASEQAGTSMSRAAPRRSARRRMTCVSTPAPGGWSRDACRRTDVRPATSGGCADGGWVGCLPVNANALDHVALWVADRDPLAEFLCTHLGMHEI